MIKMNPMKDTIYLCISARGVQKMTKSMPDTRAGEIAVRLEVEVDASALRPPVLTRKVHIADWRDGIELSDVEFREGIITDDEATLIRQRRLDRMEQILAEHGYKVERPATEE
jgi:hypothetical protein